MKLNATADPSWASRNSVDPASIPAGKWKALPHAVCSGVEATSEYNRRTEMEMSATPAEVAAMVKQYHLLRILFLCRKQPDTFTGMPSL